MVVVIIVLFYISKKVKQEEKRVSGQHIFVTTKVASSTVDSSQYPQ